MSGGFLFRFSPGSSPSALLETMLVGRHKLLDRIETDVRESIAERAGHHWLLVGPRGAGKTHLLAVLRHRIAADPELAGRVAIAWLREEERGVTSYLDWLVVILQALHRSAPDAFPEPLPRLTGHPREEAQRRAERMLVESVGTRQILLLAENLGQLFSSRGIDRAGQQPFRDLVQRFPQWCIIASSQALVPDLQSRDAPFFGFFRVRHLQPLGVDDSLELFCKLARHDDREALRSALRSPAGRAQVRAVHHLAGGNPRLLVSLYHCLKGEELEAVTRAFLEMVDGLTAYYQERLNGLSPLQQKIVHVLAAARLPLQAKEVAARCFVAETSSAKQLGLLLDLRYLRRTKVGRQSHYELAEPLLRLCFEVKEQRDGPLRLLIDFLGTCYTQEERDAHPANEVLSQDTEATLTTYTQTVTAHPTAHEKLTQLLTTVAFPLLDTAEPRHTPAVLGRLLAPLEAHDLVELATPSLTHCLIRWLHPTQRALPRLRALAEHLCPELETLPRMELGVRLFRTGVAFLESEDPRTLLTLPLEERKILEGMLDGTLIALSTPPPAAPPAAPPPGARA